MDSVGDPLWIALRTGSGDVFPDKRGATALSVAWFSTRANSQWRIRNPFKVSLNGHARPANSRVSVDTLIFSPSLMNSGTRISMPVSSLASLVTFPPPYPHGRPARYTSPPAPPLGSCNPMGLPLYLCN